MEPMNALVLGFAALAAALIAINWYAGANTAVLARTLRLFAGAVALAMAIAMLLRGQVAYALPLAVFALFTLLNSRRSRHDDNAGESGRTSRVTTATLDMELDLDSGAMRGQVGLLVRKRLRLSPAPAADPQATGQHLTGPQAREHLYLTLAHHTALSGLGRTRSGSRSSARRRPISVS